MFTLKGVNVHHRKKNIVGKKLKVAYNFTIPYPMVYKLTFIYRNIKCFDALKWTAEKN